MPNKITYFETPVLNSVHNIRVWVDWLLVLKLQSVIGIEAKKINEFWSSIYFCLHYAFCL